MNSRENTLIRNTLAPKRHQKKGKPLRRRKLKTSKQRGQVMGPGKSRSALVTRSDRMAKEDRKLIASDK